MRRMRWLELVGMRLQVQVQVQVQVQPWTCEEGRVSGYSRWSFADELGEAAGLVVVVGVPVAPGGDDGDGCCSDLVAFGAFQLRAEASGAELVVVLDGGEEDVAVDAGLAVGVHGCSFLFARTCAGMSGWLLVAPEGMWGRERGLFRPRS